jgi:hypothetical protein
MTLNFAALQGVDHLGHVTLLAVEDESDGLAEYETDYGVHSICKGVRFEN